MFDSGVELRDGGPKVAVAEPALDADSALLSEIAGSCRTENRAAARKVLAAGRLWDAWIERDAELMSGKITDCGNAAIAELAVRLGCSKTVAESYASLGMDLRLRLPLTMAAFEAGDLDLPRARAISRETTGLTDSTTAALEPQILSSARHLSPGPLAREIERLVAACSPEEAAEQRADAQKFERRVVKRRGRGCATVEVTVSPEEGEAFMQLVAEFAGTVCRHDRRGAQERLVDSVLALVHGEPYLECTCGRPDCAAAGVDALPGRRAPLTQITIDLPTLLGLLSEPAYLHGHGLVDPALARELAATGTWQAMLTEALELAEELGLVEHEVEDQDQDDPRSDPADVRATNADTAGTDAVDTDTAETRTADTDAADSDASVAGATNTDPPPSQPPRFCVRSFLARGGRRKAGPVPSAPGRAAPRPQHSPPTSVGTLADAILAAVQANPALAQGVFRDGHGGLLVPPSGALTYRPDAATAALVRARDQHCRFPGCNRPAAQCQLDHIVEYLVRNPLSGGWTIVSNLQCLCAFHHQLKTLGLWKVVTVGGPHLGGHTLMWTSTLGANAVTLPGGSAGAADLSALRPRITGRRGTSTTTVPETDPDPPPF
ncbi:DUF222 domain-containing protein [Rhodococcus sp. NPDC059234]|uniref:HNH endonuclease signature motif containing protein n=1 Tax=Rhodococcus sp. NPDC059234 TaxID=3346781 RepID=UPI00366DF1A2